MNDGLFSAKQDDKVPKPPPVLDAHRGFYLTLQTLVGFCWRNPSKRASNKRRTTNMGGDLEKSIVLNIPSF
jgi:hypothetical protein